MKKILCLLLLTWIPPLSMTDAADSPSFDKINRSEAEWRKRLTPEQFDILRKEGTEPSHSSSLNHEHRKGTFVCAACELPLFQSETKYDSGTGWPSFYDIIEGHVETKRDWKLLIPRIEYHCARCGSHQGHLFNDGPKPTGLRYCNNGLALSFVPDETENAPQPQAQNTTETAIFAAGCFWCIQPPYEKLQGVLTTIVGYTGGHLKNPTYEQVSYEDTGHYESIQLTFDPSVVSYKEMLKIFWHNIDPLDDGGQFCDRGDSYRSAIFYLNDSQKKEALQSKAEMEKFLKAPIATQIIPASTFYPAEDYHQDYHKKNPIRYKFYRFSCGRDKHLKSIWG